MICTFEEQTNRMVEEIQIERSCYYCDGDARSKEIKNEECFSCGGSGLFKDQDKNKIVCDVCDGDGVGENINTCFNCHGNGWVDIYFALSDIFDTRYRNEVSFSIIRGDGILSIDNLQGWSVQERTIMVDDFEVLNCWSSKLKKKFSLVRFSLENQEYFARIKRKRTIDLEQPIKISFYKAEEDVCTKKGYKFSKNSVLMIATQ